LKNVVRDLDLTFDLLTPKSVQFIYVSNCAEVNFVENPRSDL